MENAVTTLSLPLDGPMCGFVSVTFASSAAVSARELSLPSGGKILSFSEAHGSPPRSRNFKGTVLT